MKPELTSGGGPDPFEQMLVGLLATATGFVLFELFITQGWADLVMVVLALAVPMAMYAVRREARRHILEGHSADNPDKVE